MEGKRGNSSSSSSSGDQVEVAPFVAKTYEMVSEPMTDALIRWGRGNNSFLVMDAALFSHLLLPAHFKHSNFSSFVRQLNTYGFRKVDPDKWEFAHESFLRGQTHLLPLIVRRRRRDGGGKREGAAEEEGEEVEEEEMLLQEVGRLRREQRVIDEELQGMSKRLQATERRPRQMMSFLTRVAEEPDFLPRLITSKKEQQKQRLAGDKKRRLLPPPPPPPPLRLATSETVQSLETRALHALEHRAGLLTISREKPALPGAAGAGCYYGGAAALPAVTGVDPGGTQRFFPPEFGVPETSSPATDASYPFSLLGQGFF